MVWCMERE